MRRFLSLVLVLMLCLSMAACGKKTEDSLSDGVLTVVCRLRASSASASPTS